MEEEEQLMDQLSITTYEKGSRHGVKVTHVIDPHNFYILPLKYIDFLHKMESTVPATKYIFSGQKELVVFRCTNPPGIFRYVRGWICNVRMIHENLLCDIYTIDYGHVQKSVSIQHIWQCNEIFARMPALATICQLSNCFPIQYSVVYNSFRPEPIHAFKTFVLNKSASIQVLGKTGRKLIVSLVNSNSHDIATLMAIRGFSQLGHYRDPIAWRPIIILRGLEFGFRELEIDQTLYVRMQSGTSLNNFYVATISDYENHLKETNCITYYARRELVLYENDIKEGLPVCVKDDIRNMYERACIKRVNYEDKTAMVQLVDWGRHEIYNFNKLKYMSVMCLRTPVLTIFCNAQDCKFWGENLETFLTPGFEFLITIKNLGHGLDYPNTVEIHPLNNCLDEAAALPN